MVAISLYRGNLHRAPDVPRRWLMPNPKISLKDFKTLLARRSKALSKTTTTKNTSPKSTSSNPNPNSGEGPSTTTVQQQQQFKELEIVDLKKPLDASDSLIDSKNDVLEKPSDGVAAMDDKTTNPATANAEKRTKEVEDKLQLLNARKHNLVLVLKQILNAEEELKRRNSQQQQQAIAMRGGPSVLLQADGTNDNGSVSRRLGPEGTFVGDVDGGDADDSANNNLQHDRLVPRTSSMSPSSESPLRKTPNAQQNMVSYPARASLGATGSPSRFALYGQQGNPVNLPPSVSVSGTGYIASSPSPSPAASGGTSVFRDARHPSPWK